MISQWSELTVCLTCSAIVPTRFVDDHEQWHARIAQVAIDNTARLDALGAPPPPTAADPR